MPALYIRSTTPHGSRSWAKVGHFHPLGDGTFSLVLQVGPGKVYHRRVGDSDLVSGSLPGGRP